MFERYRPFARVRKSWFLSSRLYLLPLLALLGAVNAALALISLLVVLILFLLNIFRARLPIDPGRAGKAAIAPETLIYKREEKLELKMDLWRPEARNDLQAVVVFAHGGGWISGFRNQPNNISWCRFLQSRGFAVASLDYRFGFRYSMEDIIRDFSDAVDFVREEGPSRGLNTNRIILMGLSAGGHLALSYAAYHSFMDNSRALKGIRGVVAYYAPSDLRDLFGPDGKSLFARFAAGSTLKTLPRYDEKRYRHYSPLTWITPRMLPVAAVHGRRDRVVPFRSSFRLVKRLRQLGIPSRFLIHKKGDHGFEFRLKDYRTTRILEETLRFMRDLIRD